MSDGLDRFILAQDSPQFGFAPALRELETGGKRGHWIWYVFPQLAGLGSSWNSEYYGITGAREAIEYLRHPVLRGRLVGITRVVTERLREGAQLKYLMGSDVDTRKIVSSMTLFRAIADSAVGDDPDAHEIREFVSLADEVLACGAAQGYPPCAYTRDFLERLH
jgi:uncharacterized protein (DUF1810 family)